MRKILNVLLPIFLSVAITFTSMYFIHKNQGDEIKGMLYIGIIGTLGVLASFIILQYLKRKEASDRGL